MRLLNLPFICAVLLSAFISVGCQGGPVIPETNSDPDLSPARTASSGPVHRCMGYYTLVVDTENPSVDVLHARSGNLHLNVVSVLNTTMGVSVVGVPSEHDPANGLFVFDITLTHPFGTKPQLAGFDVKGILMTPGSLEISPLMFADADETRLENADGHTRWWNPTEFTEPGMFGYTHGNLANSPAGVLTATVNPYKYYADMLDESNSIYWALMEPLDSDFGRGVFRAGNSNVRRYKIRFPMDPGPQVVFGYAVDASWDFPDPNPPVEIPDDFPMVANQPEAVCLHFEPVVNTLFYDTESGTAGGICRMKAEVHDWQGQAIGNIGDEVSVLRLFAPDLYAGGEEFTYIDEIPIKARYSVDLTGIAVPTHAGEIIIAMRAGTADGSTYDQGLGPAPSGQISAWKVFTLEIPDPECVADDNNSHLDAEEIYSGDTTIGELCGGTDDEDWFRLEVLTGYKLTGDVNLYCDADSSGIILHDADGLFLAGASVVDGIGTINLDDLDIGVGTYYFNVFTSSINQAVIYLIETDTEDVDIKPNNPVDVTPDDLFLDPYWAEMHGNYLYLQGVMGFWILDVTIPDAPVVVSRVPEIMNTQPAFCWPYIYYAEDYNDNPSGIDLLYVSDPTNPIALEDVLSVPFYVFAATSNSEHLYLAVTDGVGWSVRIYDIGTEPDLPAFVDSFIVPGDVIELGLLDPEGPETALVGLTDVMMEIYDVEDPANVTTKGAQLLLSGAHHDLTIEDDYILRLSDDGAGNCYLSISMYTSSLGLQSKGNVLVPGEALYVDANSTYAYVGSGELGLQIIKISDKDNPVWMDWLTLVSDSTYVVTTDDFVINIPESKGYVWYDIATPTNPVEIFRYPCLNNPMDSVILNDFAWFADTNNSCCSLTCLDISDPSNAQVVSDYFVDDMPYPIGGKNEVLAAAAYNDYKIWFFDVGNPYNPIMLTFMNYSDQITSIVVTDDAIYAALKNGYIEIIDISSWPQLIMKTHVDVTVDLYNLTVKGDYLYGHSEFVVYVYDISDPNVPSLTGTYGPAHPPENLGIWGKNLIILTEDTLEITDISIPDSPVFISDLAMPYAPSMDFMAVDGQFAYVGERDMSAIVPVNMWPLNSPSIFGDFYGVDDVWYPFDVDVHDGYLYELQYYKGVRIWDLY